MVEWTMIVNVSSPCNFAMSQISFIRITYKLLQHCASDYISYRKPNDEEIKAEETGVRKIPEKPCGLEGDGGLTGGNVLDGSA